MLNIKNVVRNVMYNNISLESEKLKERVQM